MVEDKEKSDQVSFDRPLPSGIYFLKRAAVVARFYAFRPKVKCSVCVCVCVLAAGDFATAHIAGQ